jgi:hypothetical protein
MAERLKGKLRSIVLERWKVKSVSRYLSHPGLRGYDDDALVSCLSCWQRLVSVNMYHVWTNRGWYTGTGYAANQSRLDINQPCLRACSLSGLDGWVPKAVTRGCAVPCHDAGKW